MRQKLLILLLTMCLVGVIHAELIPNFMPPPTAGCGGSCWLYVYQVDLTVGGSLSPSTPPGGGYFTLYDIPGLVGVASAPADWGWSFQATGITPPTQAPVDNPGITNVTFHYTGPAIDNPIQAGAMPINVGNFVIESGWGSYLAQNATYFSAQTARTNGSIANNTEILGGPVTPEPVTFVLVGGGLLALGLIRKRIA